MKLCALIYWAGLAVVTARGFEDAAMSEDDMGEIAEDLSKYVKQGSAMYRSLWQPRDCAGPSREGDTLSVTIEYTGLVDKGEELEVQHSLVTPKMREGMQALCLGESRRLAVPRDTMETEGYLKVLPNILVKDTNWMDVEVTGINNMTFTRFESGVLMSLLEPVGPEYCSQTVEEGDILAVEYEGSLEDGSVFDSSAARKAPFGPFTHGRGEIIEGYTQTLTGRCLGERWRMVVPPHMAYGAEGVEGIPGGATLTFDVRLVLHNGVEWKQEDRQEKVLGWEDIHRPDTCREIARQDQLLMHYEATRKDGFKFGSITDKYEPYGPFSLQDAGVTGVAALDLALPGMCLGGRRMVTVPPRMGWVGNNAHHDTIRVLLVLVGVNGEMVEGFKQSARRGETGEL